MAAINASHAASKPVETAHPNNLPQDPSVTAGALHALVDTHGNVQHGIHAQMHRLADHPFVHKLIPGIEKIASEYHVGNFVVMRGSGERFFESMPLYPRCVRSCQLHIVLKSFRLGMHLLFYGGTQVKVLHNQTVETVLKDLSIKQGKNYDSPDSVKSIPSFIDTYSIQTDELLEPDITKYKTFNEFFHRQLKPDARPVQNESDPAGICSAADSRLTVYPTVDLAQKFWIKGSHFNIPTLLNVDPSSEKAKKFGNASLAIFRLAPADYHRFHSPIDGEVGEVVDIPGQYYTVNPQAVNEPGFDVFTNNKRSVLYTTHTRSGSPVAFVAIGAMLVGSIQWTNGAKKGASVKRGEELGYFAYGGSTIVAIFPQGLIKFDEDLVKNSEAPIETLVKVGYSIGTAV
ncbi:hypothetical protein EUX98_g6642 [Antrodiella citrinella]|uniref:phosphatidylserine decarboxylase n=1 Tax=Antrodiella citrinella TaxID=2447956 RepID=A0A4V3XI13_9APHY|nr:hypothetical protein EUX98_g6642 [Antrodiella citrinella]